MHPSWQDPEVGHWQVEVQLLQVSGAVQSASVMHCGQLQLRCSVNCKNWISTK